MFFSPPPLTKFWIRPGLLLVLNWSGQITGNIPKQPHKQNLQRQPLFCLVVGQVPRCALFVRIAPLCRDAAVAARTKRSHQSTRRIVTRSGVDAQQRARDKLQRAPFETDCALKASLQTPQPEEFRSPLTFLGPAALKANEENLEQGIQAPDFSKNSSSFLPDKHWKA